jgi:hypothetical protein
MKNYLSVVLIDKIPVKLFVFHIIISGKITPVPEIIDPVFAKTSQNARFLLSENEHFGLVFVKTGSINSGTEKAAGLNCNIHKSQHDRGTKYLILRNSGVAKNP